MNSVHRINYILLYKSLFFTHFPAYMKEMFSFRFSAYNLRGNNILSLRKPRTTSYVLNFFSYFSSKLWNTLPDSIRMSAFTDFRREIQGRSFVSSLSLIFTFAVLKISNDM